VNGLEAVAEALKIEGVEYLFCFPTLELIDAVSAVGIRPVICRQERVGLGMADAYSRVTNGRRIGVFSMQAGPGAENAFPGVATAYSDSSPVLILPSGYPREREGWPRYFTAPRGYSGVTKWVEQVNVASEVNEAMRRAFSRLRMGRLGPVMIEVPVDVAAEQVDGYAPYVPVRAARPAPDPTDVDRAAAALVEASALVVHAGQGVLYAEATPELVELAELLAAPVLTTLLGKSGFPEEHPLSLGTAAGAATLQARRFLADADVVLGAGCSFSKHAMAADIAPGKRLIQITIDEGDVNKNYSVEFPIIGDAKLTLAMLVEAVRERLAGKPQRDVAETAARIDAVRAPWLAEWMPKLTSKETPINPYRVIWELNRNIPADDAIVTHDSGSPRDQMVPFYKAGGPRSYIGWGKSHALGTGLGFAMGAKMAAPDKIAINWMGDAAFGMTGLDFETAVRCNIPIITIVSNNSTMAIETSHMTTSHEMFRTRDLGGNYAELARALGGHAERVEDPEEVGPALLRARRVNEEEGRPVLLEMVTSAETARSQR
jgi:thiamine pyrophosphate-dependent acetolactate synthase large subunit-like protein